MDASIIDNYSFDFTWITSLEFLKTIKSPEDGSGRSNYSPLLDYKYQRIQMREEERKKSPKPSARRPSPWKSKIPTPFDSYRPISAHVDPCYPFHLDHSYQSLNFAIFSPSFCLYGYLFVISSVATNVNIKVIFELFIYVHFRSVKSHLENSVSPCNTSWSVFC